MKRLFTYLFIIIGGSLTIWAQQPKDTLNTEIVNVVKPYKPTISDAFKIKDNPEVENPGISKIPIQYSIESAPVASTFTPSKGKAKKLSRAKKEHLFDNYVSVGFGNYTTPVVEAYLRNFPDRYSEFGAFVKHHSSQGNLKDIYYNTSFYNTGLDVYYKQTTRDIDWKLDFELNHLLHHWYGLGKESSLFSHSFLDNYNPKQSYLGMGVGGKVSFYDSFFKEAQANLYYQSDYYQSSEVRFKALPVLEFPIVDELIRLGFDLDYLTGSFAHHYLNDDPIEYTHINFGIAPSFIVLRDDLHINLGAKVYANTDRGAPIKIYAYPDVNASYQLIPDVLTVFAGATGGIHFNTYRDAIRENPFISPTYNSESTNEKYRAFGGIKGKLASNIGYLFKASYADERNKALEVINPLITKIGFASVTRAYEMENSFGRIYDDVTSLKLHGEINIDFTKEFSFGGNIDFNSYTMTNEEEPWNLPRMTASVFADYHTGKWRATSKVFVVGERKEKYYPLWDIADEPNVSNTAKAYVDLNLGLSYTFSSQLTAFVKGHNLLGNQYQRFYNYPTQGAQVLGGVIFKFDM